jgi:DNA-binding LacI/PurR family transcriptional regulator
MNNAPGVGPEVRKRILEFVEEIGYKPNTLARGLSKGRINIVALILGDVRNPFYSDLAFYIQKILNENGYMVMVFNSEYEEKKELEFIKLTQQFNFAGLILITAQSDDLKNILKKIEVPVVLVNRTFDEYEGDAVFLDNFQAGYMATMHLMELGHKRIGFIAGHASSSSVIQRYYGYLQVLKNYHLPINEDDVMMRDLSFETGYSIAEEIIKDIQNRPSAFVIANDMSALGFMECCKQYGIQIPQMISIVSFDDIIFSSLKDIELTTVSQHVKEMSENTARLMLVKLKNPDADSERVILEPNLIVRKTTDVYNPNRFNKELIKP